HRIPLGRRSNRPAAIVGGGIGAATGRGDRRDRRYPYRARSKGGNHHDPNRLPCWHSPGQPWSLPSPLLLESDPTPSSAPAPPSVSIGGSKWLSWRHATRFLQYTKTVIMPKSAD